MHISRFHINLLLFQIRSVLEGLEHLNLDIGIGWDGISQTRLAPRPSDGDISESEIQESADALLEDFVLVKLALISTSAAGGEEISLVSHSFTTTTHQFTNFDREVWHCFNSQ